jgi:hydroxymethylbilane synthase
MKLRIISRNSKLALWQAEYVHGQLLIYYPELEIEIIGVTTSGDNLLDGSLSKIGGKGLFIKELEVGLLNNEADIAVHSLKDLPVSLNPEFCLAAVLKRDDASDAFVASRYKSLDELPANAIVGTSSPRRVALLKYYYPHLQIKPLRGNVITRLGKLDNNEYDAAILATAGLNRLGLEHRVTQKLKVDKFIPSIGQGALAIEVLANRPDLAKLVVPLIDKHTTLATTAESHVGRALGVSCNTPIAIHATIDNGMLNIQAMLTDDEMNNYSFANSQAPLDNYLAASNDCVSQILNEL